MLSGETAKGSYPIQAVEMMAETCLLAEASTSYPALFNELRAMAQRPTPTSETVAMAAVAAALEQNAGAIIVMSTSGNTARLVSKYKPPCPIIMVTRNEQTSRQAHLYRAVYPMLYPEPVRVPSVPTLLSAKRSPRVLSCSDRNRTRAGRSTSTTAFGTR